MNSLDYQPIAGATPVFIIGSGRRIFTWVLTERNEMPRGIKCFLYRSLYSTFRHVSRSMRAHRSETLLRKSSYIHPARIQQ
jgi:hypothetical protein